MERVILKQRFFVKNKFAIAMMYDAVLFVVMVSMSGAVLIPALQSDVAMESSVDKHREHIADEALNALLVSRVDKFSYNVGGDIIDSVAAAIGIDTTSSDGLYATVTGWLLAREQIHKTHANLIAENLGCQFRLPFYALGTNRFNIFTGDYDTKLKEEIENFLIEYLGDKYEFNLTGIWHPIKSVNFGGDIYIGDPAPDQDCYVSKSVIMMPYKPQIKVNGQNITFTRYWFEENILKKTPLLSNITTICNLYQAGTPPYDDINYANAAIKENVTDLIYGFLIDGIDDSAGNSLFPGIVQATIDYGFTMVKNATINLGEEAIDAFMGEAFGTVDDIFGGLGGSSNPIFDEIKNTIDDKISEFVGVAYGTIEEGFNILETQIKDEVINLVGGFIQPYIDGFTDYLLDQFNFIDIYSSFSEWLFDLISINEAEVTLSIWEVRG